MNKIDPTTMLTKTLDPVHSEASEAACDLDRAWFRRHPRSTSYVRPGLVHEACVPGDECRFVPLIRVVQVAPGFRARCEP